MPACLQWNIQGRRWRSESLINKAKQLESGIKDWRLLLELGSDENAGLIWTDFGKLYFWIREEDLRNSDFHTNGHFSSVDMN